MEQCKPLPEVAAAANPIPGLNSAAGRRRGAAHTLSKSAPVAVVLAAALALTGCPPSPPPPPPPPPPPTPHVLRQNGLDELTLNRETGDLSTSDVETALGTQLILKGQTENCSLGIAKGRDLAVISSDKLAVLGFIVEDPQISTPEGIRVGSSQNDVVQAFGEDNVAVIDDLPSQTGGPLVLIEDLENPGQEPGPSSLHYGFDTDSAGRVTRLRAGFWPYVAYTDYCSMEARRPAATGWPLIE